MTIRIAVGASEGSNVLVHKDISWTQIVKKYTKHKVCQKKGGEYVIGGYYDRDVRLEAHMIARTLLVIDIDKYEGSIADLEFDLSISLPCAFVAYSSWRHTPDKPRIRLIAELSRPVTPDEYRLLAEQVCNALVVPRAVIDTCSFVPNQAMFAPQCPEGAEVWTMVQEGGAYQVPDIIDVDTNGRRAEGDDDLETVLAAQPLDITAEEVDAYLAAYSPLGLDYDGWLRVGMALWHQFEGGAPGFDRWVEWSKQDAEKFDAGIMRGKWKSFGGSLRPVTMASVIHHVKQTGLVVSTASTWIDQINACAEKHELERLLQERVSADRSVGPVDVSDIERAAKAKFAELGVVLRAEQLRKLLKPKGKRMFPDIGSSEQPLETADNLQVVCDNNDVVVRYNVITKDDEILIKGESWSVDNAKSASITWLRSACHKVEMKTTNIKNFVTLLADKNQFNPVVEWINSRPWDGVSRLNEFYATVHEDELQCSSLMKQIILKRWLISAVAAAFSPNGIMARGVLVFQGKQYAGKTRWIDALAPKGLELVKTGRALNVHDKDSVKQIVSSWIAELGELDATFKKSDIAALKAFITSDADELRRPYAAGESHYARRTVFAASVNEAKFLQDDTGNSRFWVIPIESIEHAHKIDMQQVWAEVHTLWGQGEVHYLTQNEMDILNGHNERFTVLDPIFEMIHSHLDWENFKPENCKWMQVSDVLRWIGKENPTRFETICAGKALQKLSGIPHRKSHGKQLRAVPMEKISIEFQNFDDGGNNAIPF